jgi:hypothetical protein
MPAPTISRTSVLAKKAWTPANIRTSIWLDAADISTITRNNNLVSQWDDKSGNGRHVAQATADIQPTYNATGFDGKPSIDFLNDLLWRASWGDMSQPFTRIIVFRPLTFVNPAHIWNGDILGTSNVYNVADFFNLPSNTMYQASPNVVNAITLSLGTNYLRISEFNTTNSRVYHDGTLVGTANSGSNITRGITIGGRSGGDAPIAPSQWRIAEAILIDGILSTDTRQRVEGYLAWKWGLTASLPDGHFYKTKAP